GRTEQIEGNGTGAYFHEDRGGYGDGPSHIGSASDRGVIDPRSRYLRGTGRFGPVQNHDIQSRREFEHVTSRPCLHAKVCGESTELLPCRNLCRYALGEADDRARTCARLLSRAG